LIVMPKTPSSAGSITGASNDAPRWYVLVCASAVLVTSVNAAAATHARRTMAEFVIVTLAPPAADHVERPGKSRDETLKEA
jgi:hypothetical protein